MIRQSKEGSSERDLVVKSIGSRTADTNPIGAFPLHRDWITIEAGFNEPAKRSIYADIIHGSPHFMLSALKSLGRLAATNILGNKPNLK